MKSDDLLPDEWVEIHDFLFGYGFRRREKTLFVRDTQYFLKIDIFAAGVDLDAVYEQLQAPLEAWRQKRKEEYKGFQLNKINVPKVRQAYPKL